jgi:hypothetical protein
MHHRFRSLALGLLGLLVLAPAASAATAHKAASKPKSVKGILLSLGDSYSVAGRKSTALSKARLTTAPPISWCRLPPPAAGT